MKTAVEIILKKHSENDTWHRLRVLAAIAKPGNKTMYERDNEKRKTEHENGNSTPNIVSHRK